jgi:hypothetical protein
LVRVEGRAGLVVPAVVELTFRLGHAKSWERQGSTPEAGPENGVEAKTKHKAEEQEEKQVGHFAIKYIYFSILCVL